jgi:hypothetical protein
LGTLPYRPAVKRSGAVITLCAKRRQQGTGKLDVLGGASGVEEGFQLCRVHLLETGVGRAAASAAASSGMLQRADSSAHSPVSRHEGGQVNEPADGTGTILGRLGDDCAVDTVSDEYA